MADPIDPYRIPDAYKTLQVDFEADVDVIQAAYRRLAQKHHPDRVEGPNAASATEARDRMVAINAAWAILRDPARRAAYDRVRIAFLAAKSARGERANEAAEDRTSARGSGQSDEATGRRGRRSGTSDATDDGGPSRHGSAGGYGWSASGSPGATERSSAWAQRMHDRDPAPPSDQFGRGSGPDSAGANPGSQPRAPGLGHEFRSRTGETGAGRAGSAGGPFDRAADRPFDDGGPGSRRHGQPADDQGSSDVAEPHAGPPPGRPTGSILNFGRYNGWSLGEIGRVDPGYLQWLDRIPIGRPYRGELDELLRRLGMRQSEAVESAERRGLFRRR
jgi:curved DNA-binding protein CbpA